ncbi:hypothetical protein Mgra_00002834 [Meloidogyne graminicola]|uniref:Uncharacterized protein n=1 Tax=Meloidogyne graminicola TaxID=189291 RepID=A0A8S9ZWY6_9BILA|nr:hypothetical protein Mgra_00002834 [Meloidogyne graminicola]
MGEFYIIIKLDIMFKVDYKCKVGCSLVYVPEIHTLMNTNKLFITLILFSYIFHNNIVNAARATFCDLVDSGKENSKQDLIPFLEFKKKILNLFFKYFTYYTSACNKKETIDKSIKQYLL